MKILMVTDRLGIGGAETHILSLAKGLQEEGHHLTLVSSGGVLADRCGLSHDTLPLDQKDPFSLFSARRGLKKLLKKEKFDIVHAHARLPAILLAHLQKHLPFRLVTTAHLPFPCRGLGRFSRWGEKTLAVSQDIKDHLIAAYHLAPDNIAVTINGIDTRHFAPSPSYRREGRNLLHISRLDDDRSLTAFLLLSTVTHLRKQEPTYTLTIVGSGTCFAALKQEANRLDPEGRFLFLVGAAEDPLPYLQRADAFIGVSRAALEAMACALPVILSGDEGFLGLLTPQNLTEAREGNLCCRGHDKPTAAALAASIEALFQQELSERQALGSFGRQTVLRHHSIRRMVSEAVTLYTSLPPRPAPKETGVLLAGYFGYGNTGDEAILQAEIAALRKYRPSLPIAVLSAAPKRCAATHHVKAIHRFSLLGILRLLSSRPQVIFGGGGLLQDSTSLRSLLYYCALLRLAARFHCEITAYALGIGPLERPLSRRLVRSTLQKVTLLSVRDNRSYALLRGIACEKPILFSEDPAALLLPTDPERLSYLLRRYRLSPRSFFLLCPKRSKHRDEVSLCRELRELCRHYQSQGLQAVLLPMFPMEDLPLCRAIAGSARELLLIETLSPAEVRALIGAASFVLSMRLHALILATAAGVPCYTPAGDRKTEDFLRERGKASFILPIPLCPTELFPVPSP